MNKFSLLVFFGLASIVLTPHVAGAPVAPVGDIVLRHDVEYLADRGLMSVPITTWPISWADLLTALDSIDSAQVTNLATQNVIIRLEARVARAMQWDAVNVEYSIGGSDNRSQLRTFDNRPRGSAELKGKFQYTGKIAYVHIEAELSSDADDDQSVRFDESRVGFIFGNTAIEIGGQSSWWGPGHAGSLILSNNARAVPGIAVRRNVAEPFRSNWLRWLGPWSAKAFVGQLESDRVVPDALLLGARVTIKPRPYLELGVSRTAQWAGSDRPDSFNNFVDLLLGRDNNGEVARDQEPGNQLAGFDARLSLSPGGWPLTLYGQLIGEDEAGGFPSRYLGMGGLSTSFAVKRFDATARLNLEYSDTTCQFHENSRLFNCAYNNSIYQTGYRYRGRSLGHSTDNDSQQFALIATLVTANQHSWVVTAKTGELNRGGPVDIVNPLTQTPVEFTDFDVKYSRPWRGAQIELGLGYFSQDTVTSASSSDPRLFFRWSTTPK